MDLKFDLTLEEQFQKKSMLLNLEKLDRDQLIEVASNLIDINFKYKACIKSLSKQALGIV